MFTVLFYSQPLSLPHSLPSCLFCAALGIFAVAYFPVLLPFWSLLLLVLFACFFLRYRYFCFSALLIGIVYGCSYGHYLLSQQWPDDLSDQRFLIQGHVTSVPEKSLKRGRDVYRFQFTVQDMAALNQKAAVDVNGFKGSKILLSWQTQAVFGSGSLEPLPDINAGDQWRFEVKLRRPRGFVNPAGFDYQLYLLQQNMMANGYVRKSRHNQWLGRECKLLSFHCWRHDLSKKIQEHFPDLKNGSVILGLLVGDRQGMTAEQWDLLKNTGTIHLLAISGLHVGLAAAMGLVLGRCCMRAWQGFCGLFALPQKLSGYSLPSLCSLFFAATYSLLAGFSLPTQRALIMIIVFHLCCLLYRKISPWLLLLLALFFVALYDPLAVRTQGFWLSFLAVAVLLLSFGGYCFEEDKSRSYLRKFKHFLFSLTKAQWVMTIGLFLPSVILIQGVSLSSPLANLIAIPLVSFITVPLLMCSLIFLPLSIGVSHFLLSLSDISLDFLFYYLDFIQHYAGRFWYFSLGEIKWVSMLLAISGLLWLLLPKGRPYPWLGCLCFLPLFFPVTTSPLLQLTFLDVGQGTAIVVNTAHKQLVYDTGKKYSERFDSGKHIVAPFLLHQGYQDIEMLITSHGDSDHNGGTAGLQSLVEVSQHLSGEPNKTGGQQCVAGQQWQWGHVHFSVLWPTPAFLEKPIERRNANNHSCVVLIQYGEFRVLLTGDIEKSVEQTLLNLYPEALASLTVMLVPHHGSQTSSHSAWVAHLQPAVAVVTAGFTNAYGHPHPKVLARYQAFNSRVEATGNSGAINMVLHKSGRWEVQRWREWKKRYWYD